ncbi:MAG TPA: class I SAM-dependent methyltransferase [Acidimicrobiia bacterium]|jgi:SAM-dependent methyltransferase|nr:class I SAM-dependent methyltransferase [Acidimicrobiia bacterium]
MSAGYTFGDTDLARERLELVADTFATPTRRLLGDLPPGARRYVLDVGCGPGHTTALLCEAFPDGFVTGLDASEAMILEARARVRSAQFVVADVTQPLRLPAHVVYSRLLLGHLADQRAALATWAAPILVGGTLTCEEPVRYRSELDVFVRYEAAVTTVVAAQGGTLWASSALDDDPPRCTRAIDRVVEHPVSVARAAAMFWRNAVTWGGDADLIDELRDLEASEDDRVVLWELRQTAWLKH